MHFLPANSPAKPSTVQVSLEEASGRITAGPVFARYSVPGDPPLGNGRHRGCQCGDTGSLRAAPGHPSRAARVNTGNVVPPEFDAVIMIEDVWETDGQYTIRKSASPWQHVRPAGEDLAESEMVMPSAHRIRAHEIGALATYGITHPEVIAVRVGLVPTGSELVPAGTRPNPGRSWKATRSWQRPCSGKPVPPAPGILL